jgi:hypothetical protein
MIKYLYLLITTIAFIGCDTNPQLYCFELSSFEIKPFHLYWSPDKRNELCFSTMSGCQENRTSIGTGVLGQPPIKGECKVKVPGQVPKCECSK